MSRIKTLIAGAAVAAVAGGGLLVGATPASAATTPPWEPDPQAVGTLAFYDASGNQVTSGVDLTNAFTYAVASNSGSPDQAGATKAHIGYAFPQSGEATSDYTVQQTGGNNFFPIKTGAPANIAAFTTPVNVSTAANHGSDLLDNVIGTGVNDPTAGYNQVLQVRLFTSGGGSVSDPTEYWASDISYNTTTGTWAEVFPTAPVVTLTKGVAGGSVGVAYSAKLAATGGKAAYKYAAAGNIPPGIKLSSAGAFSGTPTTPGTYTFPVTVTDASKPVNSNTEDVTIKIAPMQITTTSLPSVLVGVAYKASLTHIGGKNPLKYLVTAGALPTGIKLSTAGAFTGAAAAPGTYSFTVTLTDGSKPANVATKNLSITVTPMSITTASLPNGTVKKAYSAKLTAAGGKTPLKYVVSSGALPTGVKLSTAGAFTGTPTTAGSYTFTVTLTDATKPVANVATATYTVVIS